MTQKASSRSGAANRAASRPSPQPESGFSYHRDFFEDLVDTALGHAKKLGATDAAAEASEGCGLSVSVRKGELENVERNRDKSLGITVYIGKKRGNAATSDFSKAAIEQTVKAAYDIARFTAEDETSGLPDDRDIARVHRELDLFHPWSIDSEQAAQLALKCEAAALGTSRLITNSEGAGVSAQQSHFFSAHTKGFRGGYASSRHSISVAPIAGKGNQMQRDAWYSSMRDAAELAAPEAVGRYAAERALARLKSRKIPTTQCPVLFESPLAAGLLGGFVQAVSGGALYRKSTFLADSLGKPAFPKHIDINEDPHLRKGKGSAPFDEEGVKTQGAPGGGRWPRRGLLPEHLFGPQAGHAHHRQCRRLAQPDTDQPPDPPGRRPGRHAAQAGPRPVRDRADGAGRELRDGRLFARRLGLLGRKRPHRLSG
jgi:PmbA protein